MISLQELRPKLEALGETKVRGRLAQGVYGEDKAPIVQEWLAEKVRARQDEHTARSLDLAESANVLDAEGNAISRRSNLVSWIALVVSLAGLVMSGSAFWQTRTQRIARPVEVATAPITQAPGDVPRYDQATLNPVGDNWNRMNECAAQADKVASRARLDSDKAVLGRQNHYSPANGHCHIEISYLNSEARKNPGLLPETYYELWDAFEERLLSTCTDGPVSGKGAFCNIQDRDQGFVDCEVCRSFVRDRMTK